MRWGRRGGGWGGGGAGAQHADDARGGRTAIRRRLAWLEHGEVLFGQRGQDEVFLGGEVPVDGRRRHARAGNDVADTQGREASLGDEADGGVHDLLAAFGLSVVGPVHPGS